MFQACHSSPVVTPHLPLQHQDGFWFCSVVAFVCMVNLFALGVEVDNRLSAPHSCLLADTVETVMKAGDSCHQMPCFTV